RATRSRRREPRRTTRAQQSLVEIDESQVLPESVRVVAARRHQLVRRTDLDAAAMKQLSGQRRSGTRHSGDADHDATRSRNLRHTCGEKNDAGAAMTWRIAVNA